MVRQHHAGATVGALPITDANRHLLQSGYTRRRPEELAVLTRWVCWAAWVCGFCWARCVLSPQLYLLFAVMLLRQGQKIARASSGTMPLASNLVA
jgi:hypothetical protein